MLQLAFGLDALHSGLITFAGAMGAIAVKPLARGFLLRFGFRRLLIVNGVLASAVLLASALFTAATPHLVIMVVLLFGGFLRSLQFTSLSAITYAEIEPRQIGAATSMASVASRCRSASAWPIGRHGGGDVGDAARARRRRRQPTSRRRSWSVGLMSMASALLMLRLPGGAGDEIAGRRAAGEHALRRARDAR